MRREVFDDYINRFNDRLQAVTAEDIQRVAKTYLKKTNRSVAIYHTKGAAGEEDDPLAGLPEERRAMAKRLISMLPQLKDPGQLQAMLGQLETRLGEAGSEEEAASLGYMIEKIRQRLEQIEAAEEDPS